MNTRGPHRWHDGDRRLFLPALFHLRHRWQIHRLHPFTLIFVLIASIFVALVWYRYRPHVCERKHSTLTNTQEEYTQIAREWYAGFATILQNRRGQNYFLGGMVVALVLVIALPIIGVLKVNFFPQDDSPFIFVDIAAPPGTSLNKTDLSARAVEETLYGDPRIESLVTTVGASSAFQTSAVSKRHSICEYHHQSHRQTQPQTKLKPKYLKI